MNLNLFIRSDDINEVVIADDETGYAVATFYYQSGIDRKPLYNALDHAELFIRIYDLLNELRAKQK